MKAKLYTKQGMFLARCQVPEPPPATVSWRQALFLSSPHPDEDGGVVYVEQTVHVVPEEIPNPEATNRVWNGTAWVSGETAPQPIPEVAKPPGSPLGNYVPATRTHWNDLPGSPQASAISPVHASPQTRVVQNHAMPAQLANPWAPPPQPAAPADPNNAWAAKRPAQPLPQPLFGGLPVGPQAGGERPMTAQEMALVAASRRAPNGALSLGAPQPVAALAVPQAPQPVAALAPQTAIDPVEAQRQAAVAAAQSQKV